MHKLRRRVAPDDSAKKARLLHGCNLAFLALLLCTTLLAGSQSPQATEPGSIRENLSFYEGLKVSSVELAGQPEIDPAELLPLITQHADETLSAAKVEASAAALERTGRFERVDLNLRSEQEGVRVIFILQPAVFFGVYRFTGAEKFPYNRLLPITQYVPQEPYSPSDIRKARDALVTFFRRNGYFNAQVEPKVEIDRAARLANVDFRVNLNRLAKFGDVIIRGETPDEASDLKSSLRSLKARLKLSAIREGKDYSYRTLQNATRFLASRLQGEDRLAAQVRLAGADYNPGTNRADILFDVQSGPPVHVAIDGAHFWPWTKRKLLPIYQQNGLAPELIQEGRQNLLRNLRQKGYFDVQVEADVAARPNGIIVEYGVTKGRRKQIEDVAFTGNRHFASEELRQHTDVKEAGLFSRGSYNDDSVKMLEGFYQSRGFNQVQVTPEFDTEDGNVVVTFAINEGPQDTVQELRVTGNASVSLKELAPEGLEAAAGRPYSQSAIDDDRNKIVKYYLNKGYLTASLTPHAEPSPDDPHRFRVTYDIHEGPQVKTDHVITVGTETTRQAWVNRQTQGVQPGRPLSQTEIFSSESRLYTNNVFDWAEVNTRSQITSEEHEDVIVKVHEAKRNTLTYGFGYQIVNQGGSLPGGTVALPGLPPIGVPASFRTNQHTVHGPRVNALYTRNNVRGKGESLTLSGLYGPLDKEGAFVFTDPNFRWTSWTANLSLTGQDNSENPTFTNRQGQFGFQIQKPITAQNTQNLFLRYTLTQSSLSDLLIPELVPPEDRRIRLSTLGAAWIYDTRDAPLDARKGMYNSFEVDLNPAVLGSSANFAKILAQGALYRSFKRIVWANSLRLGFAVASSDSHVPLSQKFFTGGGSTLRGFPLNGAGPQRTIFACGDPADPTTCALLTVPTGGRQLLILNSELRLPIRNKLSLAVFYDGGNVFNSIGFKPIAENYTNSVGFGFRYSTPVGPIRFDVGHNLSPIPGIKSTQIFVTLGQPF